MTRKQKGYIAALQRRVNSLTARIESAECKKLDDERHERNALLWAIEILNRLLE
jgi:hypothetical protein